MANWDQDSSRKIGRRFVITGTLVLDTPASFSNGETIGTEIVILEDALERRPLLPGASIAGALRHYILNREVGFRYTEDEPQANETENQRKEREKRIKKRLATQLFGESLGLDTERMESRVIVNDALGYAVKDDRSKIPATLTRREGVKIEGATRTADEGMLFSTQVWEKGTRFDLRFELMLYDAYKDGEKEFPADSNDLVVALASALLALESGEIPMGGRKNRGYGRAHVEPDTWQISYYKFNEDKEQSANALVAWLKDAAFNDITDEFRKSGQDFIDNRQYVEIKATMRVLDSILIRASSEFADHEHLNSNGDPVLSATSLAGALRARALKIANTINQDTAETLVNDLFGQHGSGGETDDLTASRLIVEEHAITDGKGEKGGQFDMIQNRVKIDRFTGGAFETALFNERPLFADWNTFVQINLTLHYPENPEDYHQLQAETGLLLLLLKDLWTEDLSLGGESSVGRGRLQGVEAGVVFGLREGAFPTRNTQAFEIRLEENGLTDGSAQFAPEMEAFVEALWDKLGA